MNTTLPVPTADILAIYEAELDGGGRLRAFRRTRRYSRSRLDCTDDR